ncbi:MAG: hypothetical protein M1429_01690 [Patescibacteria group bacterium]|nr:hypothetical protein [Patescibacteria group bacterium]
MIWILLEIALAIIAGVMMSTQVIFPLLLGRPTFPIFRRQASVEKALAGAREDIDHAKAQRRINALRREADEIEKADYLQVIREEEQTQQNNLGHQ